MERCLASAFAEPTPRQVARPTRFRAAERLLSAAARGTGVTVSDRIGLASEAALHGFSA